VGGIDARPRPALAPDSARPAPKGGRFPPTLRYGRSLFFVYTGVGAGIPGVEKFAYFRHLRPNLKPLAPLAQPRYMRACLKAARV